MKKAFTLLELVFVIVVVGILSTIAISKINTNDLLDGAKIIAKDIEYTRHLAIIDDTRKINQEKIILSKAEQKLFQKGEINPVRLNWRIKFFDYYNKDKEQINNVNYNIYKGTYSGKPTLDFVAIDYFDKNYVLSFDSNKKPFQGRKKTSKRLDIKKTYGIDNIEFLGGCDNNKDKIQHIIFDEEGTPYINSKKLIKLDEKCIIKLSKKQKHQYIIIHPQTGYIQVVDKI